MLETLKLYKTIGKNDTPVKRVTWTHPPNNFIEYNTKDNAITFKLKNGKVSDGCTIDDMLDVIGIVLSKDVKQNVRVMYHLEMARESMANVDEKKS